MKFKSMTAEDYMRMSGDEYAERRATVLGLAKEPPVDITDEQLRSVNEELSAIEAEDARRKALADAEIRAAGSIAAGAGSTIENRENTRMKEKKARTLGEFALESWEGQRRKGRIDLLTPEYRAAEDAHTTPESIEGALTQYDTNLVGVRKPLDVEQLFAAETISGNALTYFVEQAAEGDFDVVAEGGQKPQIHFADPVAKTVALQKIPAFIKESDEIIEDAPWLVSAINGRLTYLHGLKRQNYVISQLLGTSGIQTDTYAAGATATDIADKILDAAMAIEEDTGYAADGVIVTPAIYSLLRKGKNGNSDYYGGGYWGEQSVPTLWGLPVVKNANAGGIIVGAFKACGSVVSKGGVRVEMTNSDDKDFQKNMVAIRCESRLALAVRMPQGFCAIKQGA